MKIEDDALKKGTDARHPRIAWVLNKTRLVSIGLVESPSVHIEDSMNHYPMRVAGIAEQKGSKNCNAW